MSILVRFSPPSMTAEQYDAGRAARVHAREEEGEGQGGQQEGEGDLELLWFWRRRG